jgi:hypothetical protein
MRSVFAALLLAASATAAPLPPGHLDPSGKPRLVVLSDIGNEPDDQMSFVRLLLYSNEIDIEGLIATTSTWQKNATHPETMQEIEQAYGRVLPNLRKHAAGWPQAAALQAVTKSGQPGYGLAATGPDKTSDGARLLLKAARRPDSRPLWVALWGGANTLAQALIEARATLPPAETEGLVAKLRVTSISDQDDAGPWLRREFPDLFYVVSPSSPDSNDYPYATWTGISGDFYYKNCPGADAGLVSNEWLDANIRKGPFGAHYPRFAYIMEGDTPSFLGLIDNGLESWRNPGWGGWGGRYFYRTPANETHPVWSQGGDAFWRVTSQDEITGSDGRSYLSDQATIWRWREAYQHDFAARMDWTFKSYRNANHNPLVMVNGIPGSKALVLEAEIGQPITLDATGTRDPDGQPVTYHWFNYAEAGAGTGPGLAPVKLEGADTPKATVTPMALCRPAWIAANAACPATGVAHIILAVTDTGAPGLTSYARVILQLKAHAR